MSRRGLQIVVGVLGTIAIAAGGLTVLLGADSVLNHGDVAASVDSELRFYAAWYVLAGIVLLRAVRRIESEGTTIRLVCVGLLIAAGGRLLSVVTVGRPPGGTLALMIIEFVLPAVLVPWQAVVARRASAGA